MWLSFHATTQYIRHTSCMLASRIMLRKHTGLDKRKEGEEERSLARQAGHQANIGFVYPFSLDSQQCKKELPNLFQVEHPSTAILSK
jgi:hypothetical protein